MDLTQEMANPKQHWSIPVVKPTQDEEVIFDEALLLRYHRNLGYISLSCLQDMPKIGVIPKILRKYSIHM